MLRAQSRWLGDKAEEWAEENRGVACLNGVVDGHVMGTDPELSTEVKGCILEYPSGREGRLRFWERQHRELVRQDGVYLVIVYEMDAEEPVQYDRFVHHSSLDVIMDEQSYSWYGAAGHRMSSRQTQIPWSTFFPDIAD